MLKFFICGVSYWVFVEGLVDEIVIGCGIFVFIEKRLRMG